MPDLLKPTGWLAMISLRDPGAGMNHPSSGTPSRARKLTFSSRGRARTVSAGPATGAVS
jgi:hypothetical protein